MSNAIAHIILWIFCTAAWFNGVYTSAQSDNLFLFIIEILFFPIGIIHGVWAWLA